MLAPSAVRPAQTPAGLPLRQADSPSYFMSDAGILHSDSQLSSDQYVLKVRDLDERDRPREKMLRLGPAELSMPEVVAIVLGVGTRSEEVMAMSRRVLREYGERAIAQETSPRRMSEALDIPLGKACQLVAGFELGRRFYQTRRGKPVVVRTAAQAYEYLKPMADLQKEQLRAIYLGSRYQIVHEEVISVGSLTANIVHPREVFQPALTYGAAAVVVAHNHPSGSLEATGSDIDITRQLLDAGVILGIELLDHLIIAGPSFLSMMEIDL